MAEANANDIFKPGEIRFVDNYIPSLQAGIYTIKVEQKLRGNGAYLVPENTSFPETQEFEVSAPRFRIEPAYVQQMYPPANSQGQFQHDLPHIVLTKGALPWERNLFKDDPTFPWMALLLFDADELGTNQDNQAANLTGVIPIKAEKLLTPEEGVLTGFAHLDSLDAPDPELDCQVIDITPDTFQAVMPQWEVLKYLAHCREVKLDQKAVPGPELPGAQMPPGNGTAWYSVVVAGRFPRPQPQGEQTSQLKIVHLVSLEGLGSYIQAPETIPQGIQRIRLVSLTNWVFTCLPQKGESFSELMLGLVAGDSKAALEFNLLPRGDFQSTETTGNTATEEKDLALRVLKAGYVPCSYRTRLGEQTFAWYHGPFTPQLVPRLPPDRQPFSSAAQAMIYDDKHGLFDQSYAVAWEIGRLLALADQRFGMLLLNRRRKAHRLVDLLHDRIGQNGLQLAPAQAGGTEQERESGQFQALLKDNLISAAVVQHLVGDFASQIEPVIFKQNDQKPPGAKSWPAAPLKASPSLAGMHAEPDVQQFLKDYDREELDQISEWLARLYLLYGVPFNHLVPDERLLPPESIRFFYLDRNWLEVMLDGALSIGMHSSRDTLYQNLVVQVITTAVQARIHSLRESLLGNNNHNKQAAGNNSQAPLAGLLIRSAVVSGWPGLEVRAYRRSADSGDSEPIGLLRMDRMAPDVLLCIFNQVPAWIEFNEPKEGLHFGVDNGEIGLRYVGGDQDKAGRLIEEEKLQIECDQHHRLEIQKMLDALNKKKTVLGLNETEKIGPAAFALQMVNVPQQMVFKTTVKTNGLSD